MIGNIIGDIKVRGRYWTILGSNARFTIQQNKAKR